MPRLLLLVSRFNPTVVRLKAMASSPTSCPSSRFNPTVVRLKVVRGGFGSGEGGGFNPTVVRLKGGNARRRRSTQLEFQSHCGAIKRDAELNAYFVPD